MKILVILIISILLFGCGVQKSEHEKVVIENGQSIEKIERINVLNEELSDNVEILLNELNELKNEVEQLVKKVTGE